MRPALIQFLVSLAVLILAVAGYGAWYAFVSAQSAHVADLESQIESKTQTALRISSARAALAQITDSEATVNSYFIGEASVVDFINQLQVLGKSLGTAVNVLSVSEGVSNAHSSLVVTLTATGSFDAVMRTVGAIEFAPYDLSLSSFSVHTVQGSGWSADLTVLVGSASALPAGAKTSGAQPL